MFHDFRPFWAEINLDNFEYNLRTIRKHIGEGVTYISVLKGNGYGHGAVELAKVCYENGIRWVAVGTFEEAVELRKNGLDGPILILSYTPETMAHEIVKYGFDQTCSSYEIACALSKAAEAEGKTARLQIKIETGMHRTGFAPTEQNANIIKKISKLPSIEITGIYTHFANSFDKDKTFAYGQYQNFVSFVKVLEGIGVNVGMQHIANSPAVAEMPDVYMQAVRPGCMQFGFYLSYDPLNKPVDLKKVMTLHACIINVQEVEAGESIGYGRTFITKRKSRIATLPFGFGDGYLRRLQGRVRVIVNGNYAPVVGKICMDQCMIDVTDSGNVNVGDEVVVIGSQGGCDIPIEEIASILEAGPGEVCCLVSRRVPRVFKRGGEIISVKNYITDL